MKKNNVIVYIISLFFSISVVLTLYIGNLNSINATFFKEFHFNFLFIIPVILVSLIVFLILKVLLFIFEKIGINQSNKLLNSKLIFVISLISIFLSGLLFLITYYPGTGMVDSLQIISNPVGFSSHYPLIYSLISSNIFKFYFSITNIVNLSFFLMELTQLIFVSVILSYVIYYFHKTFKSNMFSIFTILYFNILTIFSNLNSAHLRDTIFSMFILLLIIKLYEIIKSKGLCLSNDKFRYKFLLIIILLVFTRNNAIFSLLILMAVLFIKYKNQYKSLILCTIVILVFTNFNLLLPKKYYKKSLFQESISHPLQQVAYILKYDNVSQYDKDYLNDIMDIDIMSTVYDPFMVDEIKWHELFNGHYLNDTKDKFMKLWFKYMKKYPEDYLKAYVLNTYSLWSINSYVYWESTFLYINSNYRNLKNERILPRTIQNKLEKIYSKTTRYLNNGSIFWIYVFIGLILVYKSKKEYLVMLLPFFCIWLNLMVASPLASAFRYMCVFGYGLPFVLTLTFTRERTSDI